MSLSNPRSWDSFVAEWEKSAEDDWEPRIRLNRDEPPGGWEYIPPALMIMMRCQHCHKAVARYVVPDEWRQGGYQRRVEGPQCRCEPAPELPTDLQPHIEDAKRKGSRPGRAAHTVKCK